MHKFQGREKENIIISTVDDKISEFVDDKYLINVAVSRAKRRLVVVVTGNEQEKGGNITDLVDYAKYNNFAVMDSNIRSVFDYLYKQYENERMSYLGMKGNISEFDSENLMCKLIRDIISEEKYLRFDFVSYYRLRDLVGNSELLDEKERKYAENADTHIDFLIYNKLSKMLVVAIEVDGYEYHKEDSEQGKRDKMKDNILKNICKLPLLRFKTNGSREKEKILDILDKY